MFCLFSLEDIYFENLSRMSVFVPGLPTPSSLRDSSCWSTVIELIYNPHCEFWTWTHAGPERVKGDLSSVLEMSRVLIVGAGLTGSVCACLIRRELQNKVHIVVWDKAKGAGESVKTPFRKCIIL